MKVLASAPSILMNSTVLPDKFHHPKCNYWVSIDQASLHMFSSPVLQLLFLSAFPFLPGHSNHLWFLPYTMLLFTSLLFFLLSCPWTTSSQSPTATVVPFDFLLNTCSTWYLTSSRKLFLDFQKWSKEPFSLFPY